MKKEIIVMILMISELLYSKELVNQKLIKVIKKYPDIPGTAELKE